MRFKIKIIYFIHKFTYFNDFTDFTDFTDFNDFNEFNEKPIRFRFSVAGFRLFIYFSVF